MSEWYEIGLGVLMAAGWRPDCVVPEHFDAKRMPPPQKASEEGFMIFGAPHSMRWLAEEGSQSIEKAVASATRVMMIEACAFFEEGIGFTCASIQLPGGETSVQGWVVGKDGHSSPPNYIMEASAFQAFRVAWEHIRRQSFDAQLIRIIAGDVLLCRHLNEWVNAGKMLERIAAGPEIA